MMLTMLGICYWHVIITAVLCLGRPLDLFPRSDSNQCNVGAGRSTLCEEG